MLHLSLVWHSACPHKVAKLQVVPESSAREPFATEMLTPRYNFRSTIYREIITYIHFSGGCYFIICCNALHLRSAES